MLALIVSDHTADQRFQASLHGVELEVEKAPGVGGPGNDAWQRAMAIKREQRR